MKNRNRRATHFLAIVLLLLVHFVFAATFSASTAHADLPPLPEATPRPTEPTPTSTTPSETTSRVPVALLLLKTEPIEDQALHSVVQWQDSLGNWHDVEGWHGEVVNGQTRWWVEEKDWGDGPFRWLAYSGEADEISISKSFYLPVKAGQQLIVSIP